MLVNIPMEHMGYIVVFKCESYVQKHLLTSNNIEDHLEGIRESGLAQSRKRNSQKAYLKGGTSGPSLVRCGKRRRPQSFDLTLPRRPQSLRLISFATDLLSLWLSLGHFGIFWSHYPHIILTLSSHYPLYDLYDLDGSGINLWQNLKANKLTCYFGLHRVNGPIPRWLWSPSSPRQNGATLAALAVPGRSRIPSSEACWPLRCACRRV